MGDKATIPEVNCNREWFWLTGRKNTHLTKEDEEKIKDKAGSSSHLKPIQEKQLMLIDVFTGWSGPCLAVESHLRRMRNSFVEAPNCLYLVRACCDEIDELAAFKHDIRPNFLFWARGNPVALLRGLNRPLLTRLIQEELALECKKDDRPQIEIDMASVKVIQCGGDLALLEQDDVVRSIGCGNTDRLTSFGNEEDEIAGNGKKKKNAKPKSAYEQGVEG